MKQPENMCRVRNTVVSNIGRRVIIKENKGRNKVDITEGVIAKTYNFIFCVALDTEDEDGAKTISYSYTDVLTKEVELVLC